MGTGYIVTQRLLELIGPSWDYNFQVPRPARQLAAQLMMINSEGWSCIVPPLCPSDILCRVMIGNSTASKNNVIFDQMLPTFSVDQKTYHRPPVPPCDYFELTSLTENYLLEHNIIIQPCCSPPHPPHPPGH